MLIIENVHMLGRNPDFRQFINKKQRLFYYKKYYKDVMNYIIKPSIIYKLNDKFPKQICNNTNDTHPANFRYIVKKNILEINNSPPPYISISSNQCQMEYDNLPPLYSSLPPPYSLF